MTKRAVDTLTTAALRDLDPASSRLLTAEERDRAHATFARIVATPPPEPAPERPRRRRGLVLAGLVATVGAAVPALLLGGGSAFGSWTPTPEPLSGVPASEAATTCRAALGAPDRGEQVVIAERRGGWTYVLLTGPDSEQVCLMPEGLVGHPYPAEHTTEGFLASSGDPGEAPSPAPDRIVETESGAGSVPSGGLWHFGDDEEWVSWVQGHVGSDVTGVTVHAPTGVDVETSVAHGRFAAWWPSAAPRSDNLEVMGAWSYTLTLADGSTRHVTG